jgi:hypothetical protein
VLTFDLSADDPGLFSTQPAVASDGTLSYTPAADAHGAATVPIHLEHDGGVTSGGDDASPTQSFTITITAVNDSPRSRGADEDVLEEAGAQSVAGWATDLSAGPSDEAGQDLSFETASNDNPGLFAAAPSIGTDGT